MESHTYKNCLPLTKWKKHVPVPIHFESSLLSTLNTVECFILILPFNTTHTYFSIYTASHENVFKTCDQQRLKPVCESLQPTSSLAFVSVGLLQLFVLTAKAWFALAAKAQIKMCRRIG